MSLGKTPALVRIWAMVMLLLGCTLFTSWDDMARSWVGSDISELKGLWGEPVHIIPLDAETREYKYHRRVLDPSCYHYWHVGSTGTITGYRYKGYCRPGTGRY